MRDPISMGRYTIEPLDGSLAWQYDTLDEVAGALAFDKVRSGAARVWDNVTDNDVTEDFADYFAK